MTISDNRPAEIFCDRVNSAIFVMQEYGYKNRIDLNLQRPNLSKVNTLDSGLVPYKSGKNTYDQN